ncbi:calcium-binding protein [Xaviernesmea oryzae]|uniref:Calcium-binding protein n=1 Tax=Xaviernesmea oryzae TaxID=464029 RepID=A0A1Q9AYG5_9HYPH|nr:Tim44/TimA family putative adaptor protein [Xaviernesmea oryzae]OLP60489.1 calcium-binding protein [Xaviernesmea oryzae]SEK19558.1 Predicted lipid-binding transport protein, Tim44 family [Xaviernesmea oryzae]
MGSIDFVTLFFMVAAVIIFIQLRSVLGRRTGNEKPPVDPFSPADTERQPQATGKVVQLPRRDGMPNPTEERYKAVNAFAPADSEINAQLRRIVDADAEFDPKEFVAGARMAYEMIVAAFAEGDRKTLKSLLSREVYEGFDAAISEREKRGETVKSTLVGVDKADIAQAEMRGSEAHLTLRIVSHLISATYDKAGAVIDGDAEAVSEVKDIWTFARDTRSRDPNWKLIATESEG